MYIWKKEGIQTIHKEGQTFHHDIQELDNKTIINFNFKITCQS